MNLLETEIAVRLASFAGIFLLLLIAEWCVPRRKLTVAKSPRWASNLGLVALNAVAVRFLFPLGVVGAAIIAEEQGWGLLPNVAMPDWVEVVLAIVALDLAIYFQHVLFHAVPLFWRLHMVHHADLDFDVSTGLRFHTIEILLSMGIKLGTVVFLGAPALGVLLFEVLLNATSMFNHANFRLPLWLDRLLRLVVVTPDMHRVHHSVVVRETNSNFGFNLPWWDYVFGTYCAQPAAGHEDMTIGLSQFREELVDRLPWMLALPFVGRVGSYTANQEADGEAAKLSNYSVDKDEVATSGRANPLAG